MNDLIRTLVCFLIIAAPAATYAQSVCLPAPRLLTTMPMGGTVGTSVEVTITGDNLEDTEELSFSHPGLTATHKLDAQGHPVENQYVVHIANDCPIGVHDARLMTRLGISSARTFSVGTLEEVTRTKANTSLGTALPLQLNALCNAAMTNRMVDHYTFAAEKDQRIVIHCAADGIDSRLTPVLIVADANGNDLLVERRGEAIDFTVPESGSYVVKIHDLTFNGGAPYFYRLAVQVAQPDQTIPPLSSTSAVSSFSWPPANLTDDTTVAETEPNNAREQSMKVTLPCDISGRFFPAANVDIFEFTAKKGDVWWVEVASERLGRPTDASIIVQHLDGAGDSQKITDVAELTDIPHAIKVSRNFYSYDGPPYHTGSPDILGKIEIKQDGVHQLQLTDLFGGTRNDDRNIYRLIIRRAEPDFAVVGWALHMELRNGDRNALSKPMALRGGHTMPLEVAAIRRDGFDGDIQMTLENLPDGVTATGLKIPAGQNRGILLVTAAADAPRGLTRAKFVATATIDGTQVTRVGRLASMNWPVTNARSQIPAPRLLADIPVSVGGAEVIPMSIAAAEDKVWEVTAGEKLTIPLQQTRHGKFSGPKMSLKTYGDGFAAAKPFDVPLTADTSEAVLDLAALKTPQGDYTIAFYGSAVAKYAYNPAAVAAAEAAVDAARKEAARLAVEAKTLTENATTATEAEQTDVQKAADAAAAKQKTADAAVKTAEARLRAAVSRSNPKDIVDIVVSKPIQVRVLPAPETKK